ncbi:hypothetical protein RvY_03735 [Ramazzottius varieornatus]|uniref:BED-type domain-containing protein n=1 Tax=Ramazzottius varieornatus TaxID=947166 RepID=A0A1D1UP48_RAMVA|nr:hypothetical protein RvY_03735 [Ramazzottius varieornatus]
MPSAVDNFLRLTQVSQVVSLAYSLYGGETSEKSDSGTNIVMQKAFTRRSRSDDEMEDIAEEEEIDLTSAGIPQKRKKHSVTEKPKPTELTREEVAKGIRDGVYDRNANEGGRSEIWRAFSKVVTSDTKKELDFVSCNKCHHVYSHKVNSGTTALANHVVSCKGKSGGPMDRYVRNVNGISKQNQKIVSDALAHKETQRCSGSEGSHAHGQDCLLAVTFGAVKIGSLREKDGPRVKDILLNRGGCITLDGWTARFRLEIAKNYSAQSSVDKNIF